MNAERPHLAFPVRRGPDGKFVCVEEDTPEHVMSCENVIVRCPLGFREERPEFGWAMPDFRPIPLDLAPLEEALRRFEPRGKPQASQWADEAAAAVQHVQVNVEV